MQWALVCFKHRVLDLWKELCRSWGYFLLASWLTVASHNSMIIVDIGPATDVSVSPTVHNFTFTRVPVRLWSLSGPRPMHLGRSPTLGIPSIHSRSLESQTVEHPKGQCFNCHSAQRNTVSGSQCCLCLTSSERSGHDQAVSPQKVPMEGLSSPHKRTLNKLRHLFIIQAWCVITNDHGTDH